MFTLKIWVEMIQVDMRPFFKWVAKKHKLDGQLVHGQGLYAIY